MARTLTNSILIVLSFSLLATPPVHAAEWGSLKGRFVVDGTPAPLPPLRVDKDAFCIQKKPANDIVVIGKGNTLVNAVVYLRVPLGQTIEINPDYEAEFKKPVVLDNNGCSFHPRILLVRFGQKLVVKNSDPVSHNTNLTLLKENPIVPANAKVEYTVNVDGALPMPVACNIHTWMSASMLSLKHPYMAASGQDGTFEIKNIPVGTHEFQFWHEAPGYLKGLKFSGGATDAMRGRAKITIDAGKTVDLGDMKVPARILALKK